MKLNYEIKKEDTGKALKKQLEFNKNSGYFSGFYKLKKGEDLISLGIKFKLPQNVIMTANENLIFAEGVTCFIPEVDGKRYVVKAEDSLEKLEKKLNLSREDILNQTPNNYLYAGLVLFIP